MDTFEKKYNEALKDMMVIYPNLKGDAKLAVEHAFPELRESEDERIRKWLVDYFGKVGGKAWIHREFTCEQILAWLENRKEQKKDNPLEDFSKGYNAGYYHGLTENIPYCSSEPEWSEEDDKMLQGIIERGQSQIQWCDTGLRPEQVSWLKSLRPSWKPSEEQMAWLKLAIDEAKEPLKSQLEELYKNIRENLIWK